MRHLGDITKLNGADVPPVDVVTGGSPCQDLSVAGKRAGLAGERSGLFMEQIRVIKEMRDEDVRRGRAGEFVRPRFMVFENVPGLWSSNGGKDFAAVLEETVRIVCKEAPAVPVPKGEWPHAGCLSGVGDGGVPFSVAWRLHDAQFWGVPQRRKRIALVADFGGLSAPEILFERKGLSGDYEPGGAAREEAAGSTGNGAESAGGDITHALTARYDGSPQPDKGNGANIVCCNPWDAQSERAYVGDGAWHSLNANESGGQSRDAVLAAGFKHKASGTAGGIGFEEEKAPSMLAGQTSAVYTAGFKAGQSKDGGIGWAEEQSPTLSATPSALEPTVLAADVYNGSQSPNAAGPKVLSQTRKAYGISGYNSGAMKSANPHSGIYEADTSRTLDNNGGNPACNQGGIAVVSSVDVRNGKENQCVNGTLQSKPNGGTSLNLNNVVRVRRK